jgi:hypothetical protein
MPNKETRQRRRDDQAREVEESQQALRNSIDETRRLMDASDEMLRRHRKQCEEDDALED